jgi:hypothetical protein
VIRRYKEKISGGNHDPEPALMIEALSRYAQGERGETPPIVRFSGLPDIYELLSGIPLLHRLYDRRLAMSKRRLVARLLPRVAMMPVKEIYWLQGNEVRSAPRAGVEKEIGGIRLEKISGRIAVIARLHTCFPST